MSNRQVAEYLLPRLPLNMEGVVFLERGGHKRILLRARGEAMDLERCGTPKERRFSFFDQVSRRRSACASSSNPALHPTHSPAPTHLC